MRVVIGPVDAGAAREWTEHMLANLEVIRSKRRLLAFALPDEVLDHFRQLLGDWRDAATTDETFLWEADFDPDTVHHLVHYWANLDSLSDGDVERLGIEWAPMSARPFFDALATGVAAALARSGEEDVFAALLVERTHTPSPFRRKQPEPLANR